jgi:branched-chain amino acid aminotransferase
MATTATETIWHNGKWIPWGEAKVHIMAHALHYGSSVFEGIRAYNTPTGPQIFRLKEHIQRLFDSAKIYHINVPYSQEEISRVCLEIVKVNNLQSAYLRPVIFRGAGSLGLYPAADIPIEVAVAALSWGAYLGPEALENGVDTCISSWARIAPNTLPAMAKAAGNYMSSQLIAIEAKRHGYDEAIALDVNGLVSEGPGENIFLIKNKIIYTPPLTSSILPGITRDSVMTLAQHAGYEVKEQPISREALYLADELFFTGTAAEISPIRSVDGLTVGEGKRGPITAHLQQLFFGLFNGETKDIWGWLSPV